MMTREELSRVKQQMVLMAAYYGRELQDAVLLMYAEDLEDLDCVQVIGAMHRLRREPNRRQPPLPADIRAAVAPATSSVGAQATEIAGKITSAMNRYGYTDPARAEKYIGPVGWGVVGLMGGWRQLCNTVTTQDIRTFYAQCRDLARGQLELAQHRAPAPPLRALPARGPAQLMPAGEILRAFLPTSR